MYDPYSGVSNLLHGVISLPDASCDKQKIFEKKMTTSRHLRTGQYRLRQRTAI